MKKRVLAVLTVLLAMMIPVWCFAEEENEEILSSGEWEYYLNDDGTATIACWNGDDEEVVVPGEIDGLQVAKIGKEAFHDCSDLTSIEIPETVTAIGEGAILGCISLKSISVSPENKNFAVIDNVLFETESKTLICYPCGLTDIEYAIPEGITEIAKGAFLGSSSLMSIEIPESVTEIGEYAFSYCSSLTSIEIPESVTKIRKDAFSYCSSLRCIKIPESVTYIGEYAFSNCSSLTSIKIPESVTEIGELAFFWCDSLTMLVEKDSYAAQYAKENDIPYTYPDANDWLND